jgi:hypothetical protein
MSMLLISVRVNHCLILCGHGTFVCCILCPITNHMSILCAYYVLDIPCIYLPSALPTCLPIKQPLITVPTYLIVIFTHLHMWLLGLGGSLILL